MVEKLLIIAGAGDYPRLVIEGARRAGVSKVTVLAVKGSASRRVVRSADEHHYICAGRADEAIELASSLGCDGAILAGQVSPMSLFTGKFSPRVRGWLSEMPVKNAHTIFGKLVEEMEKAGVKVLPASSYMDGAIPGEGVMTARGFTEHEQSDIGRGIQVAQDVGRHDVGQTVLVKSGMVLAVEAFEGTNAAIRRAGRLGKGSVLFKAAREGHDWRFDIPVVGLKTLKTMKSAGVTALGFQAGRLILLDRERVIEYANRHSIAIVGVDCSLPPAPLRPIG